MGKTEAKKWKRPQDVKTFRTNDPKKMIGKYLPNPVKKTWIEDFVDEDTGDINSIERSEIIMKGGIEITRDNVQELMFAIQAGDIEDVEVCDEDVRNAYVAKPFYLSPYNLELEWFDLKVIKQHYVCYAQDINQAISIAVEFGQMHRGLNGAINVNRVVKVDAQMVPDDHQCIPEADRSPAYERKDYFKVQVRHEWFDGTKMCKSDTYYVVHAKDVGEAKERIALLLDILKAQQEKENGKFVDEEENRTTTIRKAVPFETDMIVPIDYSLLYYEKLEH